MNPYFSTAANLAKLVAAAESWIGTPFMDNACVKKSGVSCQKLVGALYTESGFLTADFTIPDGPMDWGHAHKDSLIEAFMAQHPDKFAVVTAWQPGDMVGFKIQGCLQHSGVCLNTNGRFVHCLRDLRGVQYGNLRDATYLKRIEKIWRPVTS